MQCVLLLLHCVACCPAWACYTKQKKQTLVVITSLIVLLPKRSLLSDGPRESRRTRSAVTAPDSQMLVDLIPAASNLHFDYFRLRPGLQRGFVHMTVTTSAHKNG